MNQKLTAQKAALYYGCEFSYKATRPCKMEGIYPQRLTNDGITYPVADCRLALVPLDKITDGTKELVAYVCNYSISERKGEYGCDWVNMITVGREVVNNLIAEKPLPIPTPIHVIRDIIGLLRSLGYDCDNAIQDGWAVDKTTLI